MDEEYKDSNLNVEVELRDLGASVNLKEGLTIEGTLYNFNKEVVTTTPLIADIVFNEGKEKAVVNLFQRINNPLKWSAKNPNLYTLVIECKKGDKEELKNLIEAVESLDENIYTNYIKKYKL